MLVNGAPLLWDVDPPKLVRGGTVEDAWKGWEGERFKVLEMVVPRPGQLGRVCHDMQREILSRVIEILLFGTGERPLPVPTRIRDYISSLGIQIDVMDSVSPPSTTPE